jgi:hypothetical protein
MRYVSIKSRASANVILDPLEPKQFAVCKQIFTTHEDS